MNPASDRSTHAADAAATWGVLVVGHGTRSAAGLAEFHEVVGALSVRLAPLPVEPCFLELAEPTIAVGLERLAARGARRIVVAPLLLFAAGHAKEDIPHAVASASPMRVDDLPWVQTEPFGLDPEVVALSVLRYDEAIAEAEHERCSARNSVPILPSETLQVLVGRGSSDSEALAAMREFVQRRAAARPSDGDVELAYTALAEPRLEAVLERAAASPYRRIVVQPHLLFHGELVERVARLTADAASRFPEKQWLVAAHLGPHERVVAAVVRRISLAAGRPIP